MNDERRQAIQSQIDELTEYANAAANTPNINPSIQSEIDGRMAAIQKQMEDYGDALQAQVEADRDAALATMKARKKDLEAKIAAFADSMEATRQKASLLVEQSSEEARAIRAGLEADLSKLTARFAEEAPPKPAAVQSTSPTRDPSELGTWSEFLDGKTPSRSLQAAKPTGDVAPGQAAANPAPGTGDEKPPSAGWTEFLGNSKE